MSTRSQRCLRSVVASAGGGDIRFARNKSGGVLVELYQEIDRINPCGCEQMTK